MFYNTTLLFSAVLLAILVLVQFFARITTNRMHANRGKIIMLVGIVVVVLLYIVQKETTIEYNNTCTLALWAFFLSFFATGLCGYLTYHKNEEFMLRHKMFASLTMFSLFINLVLGILKLI